MRRPAQRRQVGTHGVHQRDVQLPAGNAQRALKHIIGIRILRQRNNKSGHHTNIQLAGEAPEVPLNCCKMSS